MADRVLRRGSGHRVVARAAEGVAAQYTLEGEPSAFEGAVLFDGFDGVLRAGGGVAAGGRFEGRDAGAVKPDEGQHYLRQKGHQELV